MKDPLQLGSIKVPDGRAEFMAAFAAYMTKTYGNKKDKKPYNESINQKPGHDVK